MDTLEEYELDFLLENLALSEKGSWERLRFLSYATLQSQCTKKLSPKDIMVFPWEAESKSLDKPEKLSNEEIDRRSQAFLNILKKK